MSNKNPHKIEQKKKIKLEILEITENRELTWFFTKLKVQMQIHTFRSGRSDNNTSPEREREKETENDYFSFVFFNQHKNVVKN